MVIALFKEYFADPFFEGLPFIWNGVEDWLEYVVGCLLAFGLYYAVTTFLF